MHKRATDLLTGQAQEGEVIWKGRDKAASSRPQGKEQEMCMSGPAVREMEMITPGSRIAYVLSLGRCSVGMR